jgi:hypothetical protein
MIEVPAGITTGAGAAADCGAPWAVGLSVAAPLLTGWFAADWSVEFAAFVPWVEALLHPFTHSNTRSKPVSEYNRMRMMQFPLLSPKGQHQFHYQDVDIKPVR